MAANWALLPLLFIHSFLYGVYGYNISITASPFPSTLDFGEEIVPEATISIPAGYVAEEIGIEAFIYNTTRFVVFVWPGSLDTQGLTVANGTNLTRNTSEVMEEVYDGLYHSLGSVTNPGATDVDIKMNFSLAVVNKVNTSSVISGRIGTGAYISNTGIYVTSTELSSTLQISSSLPTYTGGITCSPSSVEIDYFTLCNATFTSSSRYSSPVIITVYVGNNGALQPNTVSIGNIQEMERSGKHLMIPADFRRNITYNAVSDGYNTSVSLSIGHVVKPDGDGTLVVEFIMAAKNDDSYVGLSILMKAGITCDGVLGGTVSGSVPTVAKTLTQQQLEESMVDVQLLDTAIRPGSIFRYNITIDLKGKTDKYKMYFDAEPSDPAVAICAMSPIYHEWNTPHILPEVTDQTYVLGYSIYNTLQNVDPDYAKVQYIVASKFHGAIDDSGSIVFKLENGAALPSLGSVTIQNLTSPIPSFTASTTEVSWNTLEPNRAVAMRVRLSLEKDTDFNNFRFFGITINNTASEFPIMVCNSFLADVNENLPCLQPQIGSLENNTQYFRSMTPPENVNFSSFPDSLDITFESINSLSAADGEMLFEIHLTFPWGVPEIEVPSNDINTTDRPLLYHFGVQVGEALIWTDFVNLTFGNHMYRQSHQLGSHPITGPDLYLKYKHAQGDTYENAPLQLEAVIQVGPGMTHDLDLIVYPPVGVTLCRPSLNVNGRDMSCVLGGDWYHGERFMWFNMSRLVYEVNADGVYARLTLLGLTNTGNEPKDSHHSTIVVNFPVEIPTGFASDIIKAELWGSGSSGTLLTSSELTLANFATPPAVAAPGTTEMSFSMIPAEFSEDRLGIIELEIQVPPTTSHDVKVTLTGSADLLVCASHVVYVGEFMPCLNGTLAIHTISSDLAGVEVDLGRVCYVEQTVAGFRDMDKVRIQVAFVPSAATAPASFSADIMYDGTQKGNIMSPTIPPVPSLPVENRTAFVSFAAFNRNFTAVKENNTAFFNVSLPGGTSIPVKIKLRAFPSYTRPSMTISNVQYVYTGRGAACSQTTIQETISNILPTDYVSSHNDSMELDTIEIDFGFLSNAGLGELTYNDPPEYHVFTLSVDAVLNDAQWNDNNAYVGVKMEITSGGAGEVTFGDATIQVQHLPTDLPVLDTSLIVENPTNVFTTEDDVKFIFQLSHLPESMAEPAEVTLMFHLPYGGYLTYNYFNATGVVPKVSLSLDKLRLMTTFTDVRFFDTSEVTLVFSVNPENNRHFGIEPYAMTIPHELRVRLARRLHIDGYDLFPDNNLGLLPIVRGEVSVTIEAPVCFDDIEIGNDLVFPDCLFRASSVLDDAHLPHSARNSSNTTWVPRVSGGLEWIEVDIINLCQVSTLIHKTHPDYLQAKDLVIATSNDGVFWHDETNVNLQEQTGTISVKLAKTLVGRYFRIYIISHYGSGKGVGFRFNFMGCFLSDERKAAQVCNTTIPADTAITELRGRHFAIDTTMDYVYFCEFSNDVEENLCYVSRDTGTIWTSLPSYIGALMGYSPSLQKMFAQDYVNKITFSTMDGINWAPETNAELILEQSSLNWVSSKAIPYLPSASGETIGSWSADANGVSKDGTILAYWGKCCQHLI